MTAVGIGDDADGDIGEDHGVEVQHGPLSSFTARSSVYSSDYHADAPGVEGDISGEYSALHAGQGPLPYRVASPRGSVQRDLLPSGGFDVPEGLPPRSSSPRRSVLRNGPPSVGGSVPEVVGLPAYRSSVSPRPSTGDIGLLPDGVPRYRLSTGRTSDSGNSVQVEGLPAHRVSFAPGSSGVSNEGLPPSGQSNFAPRISNSRKVIDGDRLPAFRISSPEEGLPAFRRSSSVVRTPDGDTIIQRERQPSFRVSVSGNSNSNVGVGYPEEEQHADRWSSFTPQASNGGTGPSEGGLPASPQSNSSDRISTVRLAAAHQNNSDDQPVTRNERPFEMKDIPAVKNEPVVGAPPRFKLPAEEVCQPIPCICADCLAHECCVQVVCICDHHDGHPHPIGVDPAYCTEQAPSSRRYDHESYRYMQENRLDNRCAKDPLLVRSCGTSSSRFNDTGTTSSGRDRRKLRPITRIEVSFPSKFSSPSLQ
ncbi:hypothetical protein KC19_4G229300 [Ceratodon purpureus]|uniref:Uncharacterized protein n=1 Tax=Ceratodon purpureus TaxID=3225 RepID=A0A8T0IE17_CERPU|nr:hypothetical protein KC19_4G229300 [Ceratodon purpureus]